MFGRRKSSQSLGLFDGVNLSVSKLKMVFRSLMSVENKVK